MSNYKNFTGQKVPLSPSLSVMPYFAYNVGGWVQKEGKMCLRNKSMAPSFNFENFKMSNF